MPRIVNKSELAEILGVAERTLTTWQKQTSYRTNYQPVNWRGWRTRSHLLYAAGHRE